MYKFEGEPNLVVINKETRKEIAKFDEKGYFSTDDLEVVVKLKKHFKMFFIEDKDLENKTTTEKNKHTK